MSRLEFLLNALNNGGDIKDFEPQSRCEEILKACCTGEECSVEPKSRIEALLKILHAKGIASGGGGSAEEEWFNDGNTHIWISLPEGRTSPMLGVGVNGTVTVDWGDGTTPDVLTGTDAYTLSYTPNHHYASAGDYVITLTAEGEIYIGGAPEGSQLCLYAANNDDRNWVYRSSIRKIEMPSNGEYIGYNAFDKCYGLSSVKISDSVTYICEVSFYCCYSLTSINLPDNVDLLESEAIAGCYGLCKIRFNGTTPPTAEGRNTFRSLPADCIISVPVGCLDAYKSATNYPDPNTYTYVEE